MVVGVRAALPFAIREFGQRQATEALGVPVRIGDVDLWLLLGAVALEDVRVGRSSEPLDVPSIDPERALLSWSSVYARIGWPDLLQARIRLAELDVDSPVVRLIREVDGTIELLPPRLSEPSAEPPAETTEGGGIPLALDRLRVKGAGLQLTVEGKQEDRLVQFSLEELTLADLLLGETGEISLGALGLQGPALRVQRGYALGGGQPAPAAATDVAAAAPGASSAPPRPAPPYQIHRVAVDRAAFTLLMEESALDAVLHFEAEGVTARPGSSFPVRASLEIAGGSIGVDGKVALEPIAFEGEVRWQGLELPLLLAAAGPGPASWVRSGVTAGRLDVAVKLSADPTPAPLRASGELSLAKFLAHDPPKELSAEWAALEVKVERVEWPLVPDAGEPRIALESVRWDRPSFHYTLPAKSVQELGGAEATPAEGAEPASPSPEPEAPAPATPRLSVAAFDLDRGRLDFLDRTVSPFYRGSVRNLDVALRGVRWPERDARDVRVKAVLPETGAVDLKGALRAGSGDLTLTLQSLGLTGFNPYSTSAAGLSIDSGDASLTSKIRIREGRVESDNDLLLRKLGVSSHGESVVPGLGVPVDLALALLRDTEGNIALAVPVTVEESGEAGIKLGTVLTSALKAALTGALQSPLKGLGLAASALQGKEQVGIDPLPTEPGAATLAAGSEERVESLGTMLASRPSLGLRLHGLAGGADLVPLRERMLAERIAAGDEPPLPDSGWLQRRRLRDALRERSEGGTPELDAEDSAALERWIASVEVPPDRLTALARARAEGLQQRLAREHGVDAGRISLGEPGTGEPAIALEIAAAAP